MRPLRIVFKQLRFSGHLGVFVHAVSPSQLALDCDLILLLLRHSAVFLGRIASHLYFPSRENCPSGSLRR